MGEDCLNEHGDHDADTNCAVPSHTKPVVVSLARNWYTVKTTKQ